jgi:hypothetical protein
MGEETNIIKIEKLLALSLACRSASIIVMKYLQLMQMIGFDKETQAALHVIKQIDDALSKSNY